MLVRYFSSARPECQKFRKYLLEKYTKEHGFCHCSMCLNKLPPELLDMAHLKPRHVLNEIELKNMENVQFLCKMCHSIYDHGYLGVNQYGFINIHKKIIDFNLLIHNQMGKLYSKYSNHNSRFLDWHYLNIFGKK